MSMTYALHMITQLKKSDVVSILLQDIEASITGTDDDPLINGLRFTASFLEIERGLESVEIDLGFRADLKLFIQGNDEDVVAIVVNWLKSTIEDAILLFNGEFIMLIKKNGITTRNANERLWTPAMLKKITIPHRVEFIPFLGD